MRHNQNRRSRGRNNRKGPNPLTRSFESNGPDVKVRGTAAHIAEKYMTLARDAQSSGDTVSAENYLQHAEHYNRIVMAAQAQFQQSQPQFREGSEEGGYEDDRGMNGRPRDRFDFNGDSRGMDDEGEERFDSGGMEGDDDRGFRQQAQPRQDQRGNREQRYDRPRYDRRDNRDNGRDDGGREMGPRGDRQDYRESRGERQDFRQNGGPPERFSRPEEPEREVSAPEAVEAAPSVIEETPAPAPRRRRGRPPRAETEQATEGETSDGAAALAAFPD
jgi:hypothetical protein